MIPRTLHSIEILNGGTRHNPVLFVHKKYCDGNGVEHDEKYPIDPESAVLLEFCWLNQNGDTVPEKIVWEV